MIKINCYSDIPGWGNFTKVYKELVSFLPNNASILEIGVGFGRGTWAMLDAIKEGMTFEVVDSFKEDPYKLWLHALETECFLTLNKESIELFETATKNNSQKDLFLNNIQQHRKYSQLKSVHDMPSEMYIESDIRSNFDLVFLDGLHSYNTIVKELNYFKNCSYLTGHDYGNPDCPDVKVAVDEFMKSNKDKTLQIYKKNNIFVIH